MTSGKVGGLKRKERASIITHFWLQKNQEKRKEKNPKYKRIYDEKLVVEDQNI